MKRNLLMFFLIFTFSFFLMSSRSSAKSFTFKDTDKKTYTLSVNDSDYEKCPYLVMYRSSYSDLCIYAFEIEPYMFNNSCVKPRYGSDFVGYYIYYHVNVSEQSAQSLVASHYNDGTVTFNNFGSPIYPDNFVWASFDLYNATCDVDGRNFKKSPNVFFLSPVVSPICQVEELPAQVAKMTRTILTTAVFCLALLISCGILSRKLYLFLR